MDNISTAKVDLGQLAEAPHPGLDDDDENGLELDKEPSAAVTKIGVGSSTGNQHTLCAPLAQKGGQGGACDQISSKGYPPLCIS